MADASGLLISNGAATAPTAGRAFPAGRYCWVVDGTFSGATISLEMLSPDGSSWIAISGSGFTAEGAVIVDLPASKYRGAVAGGPPSNIYAALRRVLSGGA